MALKNQTTFTIAELNHFSKWWHKASSIARGDVRKWVAEGRLEFLNGAWTENDEAMPTYQDIIANLMKGHEFLKNELDFVPKVGWLLDSYGHSAANARLYADAGMEALFLGKMDLKEKHGRSINKSLNFIWRPSEKNFGNQEQILVSTFKDNYCWPSGFGTNEAFVTDAKNPKFNAESKGIELINYVQELSKHHEEKHLILPWGCDSAFSDASLDFGQMDKVIQFTNRLNTKNITFMYSTPSKYLEMLKKDNISWPVKTDDGFPFS